jgi:drug/metabolite transporter (DMT)-like permease
VISPGDLLILGIVHTGIMYQLLYSAIQKLPTPITGSLSFIYPVVAMVVDNLVFHIAEPDAAGGRRADSVCRRGQ